MVLNPVELRVLGTLIEKETATPETYPLSMNALVMACNQRSSRDPVMQLTEDEVRQALHGLEDLALTAPVRDSRVIKYEHRARTVLNLRRDEAAVLCLLLLRGPQTPGEIRSRADRLHTFDELEAVVNTLDRLAARPAISSGAEGAEATGPLTVMLPRPPGSRESRYAHLLGGPVASVPNSAAPPSVNRTSSTDDAVRLSSRVEALEAEVLALRRDLKAVRDLQAVQTRPAFRAALPGRSDPNETNE